MVTDRPRWTQETEALAHEAARKVTASYAAGVSDIAPSDENIATAVLGALASIGLLLPPGRAAGDERLLGVENQGWCNDHLHRGLKGLDVVDVVDWPEGY